MTEISEQKFYVFSLSRRNDDLDELLDEGFEVADITPVQSKTGGAMFTRSHGLYTNDVIMLLNKTGRKTRFVHEMVIRCESSLELLEKALAKRKADGYTAVKTISLNAILDPEASAGIGKGTFGFAVFFNKVLD